MVILDMVIFDMVMFDMVIFDIVILDTVNFDMVIFHMVIVYDYQGRGHLWITISAWSTGREIVPARVFVYECGSVRACEWLKYILVGLGHLTEGSFRDGNY